MNRFTRGQLARRFGAGVSLLLVTSCSSAPITAGPGVELGLDGGGRIELTEAVAASPERERIVELVRRAVRDARTLIPLDRLVVQVGFGSAGGVIPEFGFGGSANDTRIRMTIDPGNPAWRSRLEPEFYRIVLHELHHVARFRAVGYYGNLLDAMIGEGLADHFMVEVAGEPPPPWAVALSSDDLHTWVDASRPNWSNQGYNHAAWFFVGGSPNVPDWTGYAVGFELVRRYLAAHPSERASTLFDAEAARFGG